jgi:hypothetical protein
MSTSQLKNLVIDKIYGIEDEAFLSALKKILDSSLSTEAPYCLNDQQRQSVQKGKQQIADGKFISNEKLEEAESKWLKE